MLNYSVLLFVYIFLFRNHPSHVPTYEIMLFLSLLVITDHPWYLFVMHTLQSSTLFTSSFNTHSDCLKVLNQHLSLNIGELR